MEDTSHDDDPFTIFLQPPASEGLTERAAWELRQSKAKRRSDAINVELMKEKMKKEEEEREYLYKAVFIGQSDSGSSYFLITSSSIL